MKGLALVVGLLILLALFLPSAVGKTNPVYAKDVDFALKTLKKECGHFFRVKEIDWKKVEAEFRKAVRDVDSVEKHWVLLSRLVARLKDGHAYVRPLEKAGDLKWPLGTGARPVGPGMFWCRIGKRLFVKNAWSAAGDSGIEPGMEVVKIDQQPAMQWLQAKIAERRDLSGYSTDEQAFFAACHWGLGDESGATMSIECRRVDGKRKRATITRRRASIIPVGPAVFPENLESIGRQRYGKTPQGYGYIHLRDTPGELPDQFDKMLAALADVPGLILDCRANGGGGCDHDAVLGRFVPKGKKLNRAKAYPIESAGENPYPGLMVVIVDAGCRSAGETVSGMFKEDGRAYMIGESHTAGMSSSKKMITLPSGLFEMKVSVRSNKARFNGGRGIEGIGVIPHEIVEYDPKELSAGVDTLIRRAEEILADFPKGKVAYKPPR